jgi:hypothetical protein
MNCSLEKDLSILIAEFSVLVDEYNVSAKAADSDFLEGFLKGRAGAYSVVIDLLKEVLGDEKKSR